MTPADRLTLAQPDGQYLIRVYDHDQPAATAAVRRDRQMPGHLHISKIPPAVLHARAALLDQWITAKGDGEYHITTTIRKVA